MPFMGCRFVLTGQGPLNDSSLSGANGPNIALFDNRVDIAQACADGNFFGPWCPTSCVGQLAQELQNTESFFSCFFFKLKIKGCAWWRRENKGRFQVEVLFSGRRGGSGRPIVGGPDACLKCRNPMILGHFGVID